ncbi:MAG: sugar phosphate isomerase/epimerase [Clostridia bacterium]|nr:sugar phosphate isomerase/epimerase [Clostridia bacterium]
MQTTSPNWPLGISTCSFGYLDESVFKAYADVGALMEISLSTDQCRQLDWASISVFSARYGVPVRSFHLPFYPFEHNNLASPDAAVRKETVAFHAEYLRKISDAGIRYAVVHPSGEPNPPEVHQDMLNACAESLFQLAETAKSFAVTLCVENLPRTCIGRDSSEIRFLTDSHPDLRVCFDVNHLLTESHKAFVRAVGEKIASVHLSDYDFVDEKHWLPGEGSIRWDELIDLLLEAGYAGPCLYEVPMKCPKSLPVPRRDLTLRDYLNNYRSLLSGEPFPVIR